MVEEMNNRLDGTMLGKTLEVYGYHHEEGTSKYETVILDTVTNNEYKIEINIRKEDSIRVNVEVKKGKDVIEDNDIIISYIVTCDELFRLIDNALDKKDYEN